MVEMQSILMQQREVVLQLLLQSFPDPAVAKYLRILGVSLEACLSGASCCCTDSTDAQKDDVKAGRFSMSEVHTMSMLTVYLSLLIDFKKTHRIMMIRCGFYVSCGGGAQQ